MTRGPAISFEVHDLIFRINKDHPTWKAPKVQEKVQKALKERRRNKPDGYPSLRSVQKELAMLRRPPESALDKPWSIVAMADYDIPPETLPVILKAWSMVLRDSVLDNDLELVTKHMTIRLAQWIARLYYVFREQMPLFMKEIPEHKRTNPDSWLFLLLLYAGSYAHYERLIELIGHHPSESEVITALWPLDAQLAGSEELADKLGEGLGMFPNFRLVSKLDKRLWPKTALRGDK